MNKHTIAAKLDYLHSESNQSLGAGASITLLLKVPAGIFGAELKVKPSGTATGSVQLFEAPTTSADGTARAAQCRSRLDSPPASPVAVFLGPTVSNDGTPLDHDITGFAESAEPWLLKPSTNYLVRLTNNAAVAAGFVLTVEFTVIPDLDLFNLLTK